MTRYWRLILSETVGGKALSLVELGLVQGTVRVEAAAVCSSSIAPSSGALADLFDASNSTGVTWDYEARKSGVLTLTFDFGMSPVDLSEVLFVGSNRSEFPLSFVLLKSNDALSWDETRPLAARTNWPGVNVEWRGPAYVTDDSHLVCFQYVGTAARAAAQDFSDESGEGSQPLRFTPSVVQVSNSMGHFNGAGALAYQPPTSGGYTIVEYDAEVRTAYLGLEDFTIEGFLYLTSLRSGSVSVSVLVELTMAESIAGRSLAVALSGGESVQYLTLVRHSGSDVSTVITSNEPAFVKNQWCHFAICRKGSRIYTLSRGQYRNTVVYAPSITLFQANNFGRPRVTLCGGNWAGHLDGVRVTVGKALYPEAAYSVPTSYPLPAKRISCAEPGARGEFGFGSIPTPVAEPSGTSMAGDMQHIALNMLDGGGYELVGSVSELGVPSNTPLARRVVLFDSQAKRHIASTMSDDHGVYRFKNIRGDVLYDVAAYDHTGVYRMWGADRLTATKMVIS